MKKILSGAAIAALVVALAPAIAQPAPPAPPGVAPGTAPAPMAAPRQFRDVRVRVMTDRTMTRDDVVRHVRDLFARLDINRDGFITRDEVAAMHAKMMAMPGDIEKRLAQHGVMIGDRGAMFDRLDANHDGSISRQEFMASQPRIGEQRVIVMRNGDGPGIPPVPGAPGMPGMEHMKMMHMHGGMGFGGRLFDMADANHDGRVSLAEAHTAALAHFDKADRNHDGRITPDERQKMHRIRVERRQS